MATSPETAGDAKRLLADTQELGNKVRRAQRGTWSALAVLGAIVLCAIPSYEFGSSVVTHCQTGGDGSVAACTSYPTLALWYWPVALVLGYGLIGAIFFRLARRRGVGTRIRPYVIGGIVLIVLAMLVTVWGLGHPLFWSEFGYRAAPGSLAQAWLHRLVGPLGVIGVGLLVLAWVERSRAVVAFGVVYLIAVAASAPMGVHTGRLFLPGVLVPGLVLLAGSALFAYLERPAKEDAS